MSSLRACASPRGSRGARTSRWRASGSQMRNQPPGRAPPARRYAKVRGACFVWCCCLLRNRTACRSRRGERAGAYSPPRAGTLTARAWCKRAAGLLRMAVPHSAEVVSWTVWSLTEVIRRPGRACCLCQGLGPQTGRIPAHGHSIITEGPVQNPGMCGQVCILRREFSLRDQGSSQITTCLIVFSWERSDYAKPRCARRVHALRVTGGHLQGVDKCTA